MKNIIQLGQLDFWFIMQYLKIHIKQKNKLDKLRSQLLRITKNENIYFGTDNRKEVRIIIGREIAIKRCNLKYDEFDLKRGIVMCVCDILNKTTKTKKQQKGNNNEKRN